MALEIDAIKPEPIELHALINPPTASASQSSSSWLRGTRGLMLAVLQNGIHAYLNGNERARWEVDSWMRQKTSESPFSFTVVCETLGLEPGCVRATLKRHAAAPTRRRLRARPNGRR